MGKRKATRVEGAVQVHSEYFVELSRWFFVAPCKMSDASDIAQDVETTHRGNGTIDH